MQNPLTIELATGTLKITLEPGTVPIQRLLGFASRYRSQRQFLLVSKVLGKHYPVTPKMMRWTYRALARKILSFNLGEDSVWLGMAETATGLGYGVYAAAHQITKLNALFIQTTRYHLANLLFLQFQETHSHATDFFLYFPEHPVLKTRFLNASSLVLIDDEISTGRTFLRLINAYRAVNPNLRQVFIVSLVNFANPADRLILENTAEVRIRWLSLRDGQLMFTPYPEQTHPNPSTINVSSSTECKKHLLAWPGRLGLTHPIQLINDTLQRLKPLLPDTTSALPILVLGTGECNAPAFLLAHVLEQAGFKVKVQATTRSPILKGHTIQTSYQFVDNYEDNISNFIYNLTPAAYQAIILCHETPLNTPLLDLLHQWQAISARFDLLPSDKTNQDTPHATLHFCRP